MNWILIGIVLTTFIVLGSPRIVPRIKAVAVQGGLLSILQFIMRGTLFDIHSALLLAITLVIKTVVIPLLIFRSIKDVTQTVEKEQAIGSHLLLLMAALIAVLSFSSIRLLPLTSDVSLSPLLVPSALTTVLVGFLILVTKTKATNQVLGFLVLENGIFAFGMTIISEFPMMVEVGVLLDLLVGVFVMGIMIYQINKTFDNIDTKVLTALGDVE